MSTLVDLDQFDRRILNLLQTDGRLTNSELSEKIGLSSSQCSRRRNRLEQDGYILGYAAILNAEKLGYELTSVVSISLATHDVDSALNLRSMLNRLENVQEAFSLSGEMDYSIKVVTRNLRELSEFINSTLLPHPSVQNVKTAIVLETIKNTCSLPELS